MPRYNAHQWTSYGEDGSAEFCGHCGLIKVQGDPVPVVPCVFPNEYHTQYKTAPMAVPFDMLRFAYEMTCESCGRDFLVHAEQQQFHGEEAHDLLDAYQVDEDFREQVDNQTGREMYIEQSFPPSFTTCPHCKQGYVFEAPLPESIEGFDEGDDQSKPQAPDTE